MCMSWHIKYTEKNGFVSKYTNIDACCKMSSENLVHFLQVWVMKPKGK